MLRCFAATCLACLLAKCISVILWIQIPNSKFSLCRRRIIATAIGKGTRLHTLLFTSLYKSINMVGMPGKVNPLELCARAYLHMHRGVLIDACVRVCFCVCRQRQSQSHQFSGVFPASPLLLITIDLGVIVFFSLSFIFLPSASYGCSLH